MFKFEYKIIISIIVFTLFIVGAQRYQTSQSIMSQFMQAKKEKNELLITTVVPIVSLNLSLGLDDAYKEYLKKITTQNSYIESIRLVDMNERLIYLYERNAETLWNKDGMSYAHANVIDNLTGDKLAKIEFLFSSKDYEEIVEKNTSVSIEILLATLVLLGTFIFLVKREFRHLKKLLKNVLKYSPKENNFPLQKSNHSDEFGLIQNAIISMVLKINSYSQELDMLNRSLEEKVETRTKELEKEKDRVDELLKIKSKFIANISHEIRTPINAIIGMTHLVSETDLDNKQRSFVDKIESASKSLLSIINDILDISKIEAQKLHIESIDFDMNELLLSVRDIIEYKAQEKELAFDIVYESQESYYSGDALRISQVLLNLLNNAIKFTQSGSVSLRVEELEDSIVSFRIKDSGIGLNQEDIETLFKPFTQADDSTTRKYGGTGLGLSISKELVELMGGKMDVVSKVDEGSEFSFVIKLQKVKKPSVQKRRVAKKEHLELSAKEKLSSSKRDELFTQLYEAAKSMFPKACEPLINEIEKYKLSEDDEEFYKKIKGLFRRYKLKEIVVLMEGYL
ncbi:hypothetical protein GJV85_05590 [Sulfurimonas aquatica]|uniref:Sensory/regulatory protein RpfC n=1 Tax=Sulfurimonas aquatica TaxID=2672570 RepID=A0A975AZS5_9BACT|nr:ATP-binding protein [Sulfurimonas aquatica]QSZ41599.1 hypothetical protein GJV85_05590 [Sulfurimonas aquatica]